MRGTLQNKYKEYTRKKKKTETATNRVNDGILNRYDVIRPHTYNYI